MNLKGVKEENMEENFRVVVVNLMNICFLVTAVNEISL